MYTRKDIAPVIPLTKGGARVGEGGGCISPNKGSTSTACRKRGVSSSRKGMGAVLWVIIIAVVLGGGYLLAQKSKSKVENVEPVVEHAVTPAGQKETEPQAVVPADWSTYRNEKYGFEFSYRTTDFSLDTINKNSKEVSRFDGKRIAVLTPTESLLNKYTNECVESAHQNLKEFCDQRGSHGETTSIYLEVVDLPFNRLPVRTTEPNPRLDYSWKTENTTVAGFSAYRYRYLADGGEGAEAVAFALNDRQSLIVARDYFYTHQDQIFDAILSTFRFTK